MFTKVVSKPTNIESMSAVDRHRLTQVHAMAVGELKRMTGLTLAANGTVDEQALNKALAGQNIERRMRLRGLLHEIGAISA
jgi:hypothetical protein